MKICFLAIILVIPFVVSAQSNVIYINADIYRDDRIDVFEVKTIQGTQSNLFGTPEEFSIKIIGFDGQLLFEDELPVSFETIIDVPEDGGDITQLDKVNIRIRIPHFSNAQYVDIYHRNDRIKRISLAEYLCNNNNVCDANENAQNCPDDCKPKDSERKDNNFIPLIIGISLLIAGIFALYFLIKKRSG